MKIISVCPKHHIECVRPGICPICHASLLSGDEVCEPLTKDDTCGAEVVDMELYHDPNALNDTSIDKWPEIIS
jgi:hypothetical protein